jgi:esterase/lipase
MIAHIFTFLEKTKGMDLTRQMEKIEMPFLVPHGEMDRQIGVEYSYQSYEQLTNSARRELKIFTPREGGIEHCGADNMAYGRNYHAVWFANTLT